MVFNTQICTTKEQSERLLALGLKKETADMWITHGTTLIGEPPHISLDYAEIPSTVPIMPDDIPAWSLHRLIALLSGCSKYANWALDEITYENMIGMIETNTSRINQKYLEE